MIAGKLKVIVGLGKTGYSCASYFRRRSIPFAVMDADSNPAMLESLRREMPEVQFSAIDSSGLLAAEEIVLSPGVPLQSKAIKEAVAGGVPVTGDIAIFADNTDKPIIAITGSNGKSTVSDLVAKMAQASGFNVGLGGNIGIPCLDILDRGHDLYVLEVSSYQLEVIEKLSARVAVVLNLSPDHLDRYENVKQYFETKSRIYRGCKIAIENRETKYQFDIMEETNRLSFGFDEPKTSKNFGIREVGVKSYLCSGKSNLLDVTLMHLKGRHNWLNALAALAIGQAIGFDQQAMIETLITYKGLPHRCEWLGSFKGIEVYNDSKSTNPGSTRAAIEGLSNETKNIVLILGGDSKGADLGDLSAVCAREVRLSFVYGRDRQKIASALGINSTVVATLEEVMELIPAQVASGDQILFSPACASLDQFRNYEHRGDEFKRLIRESL